MAVPSFLVEVLADHLSEHAGEELVFPAPGGGPLRRTNWRRRYWSPAVAAAGISPTLRFHHLRHFAAAQAIAEGAHPKAIQARIGHASIATTLNVYGGLFPSLDEQLAESLDTARARAVAARLRYVEASEVVELASRRP